MLAGSRRTEKEKDTSSLVMLILLGNRFKG